MRSRSSIRVLTTVGAATLLWMLSAVPCMAAQPGPKPGASDDSQPTAFSIKKLVRQARLIRGPVARRFRLALFDLAHRTQALGRRALPAPRDEDQVIQNDTSTAPVSVSPLVSLRPLGFFVETVEQQPFTRSLSPRSPRGPPGHA